MRRIEEIRTPRLRLRPWVPEDEAAMAAINRDPEVTRHLNRPVDAAAIDAFYGIVAEHWATHGFGFFAVEPHDGPHAGTFIGFVGVAYPTFLPAVAARPELGWRLARETWGHGYATEAAAAARDDARDRLGLDHLISIIHPDNERSQRVAAKLGMQIESQIFNPVLDRDVDVWSADLAGDVPHT
jgi:RimJ/RimL family protein N-acetyltransferase